MRHSSSPDLILSKSKIDEYCAKCGKKSVYLVKSTNEEIMGTVKYYWENMDKRCECGYFSVISSNMTGQIDLKNP